MLFHLSYLLEDLKFRTYVPYDEYYVFVLMLRKNIVVRIWINSLAPSRLGSNFIQTHVKNRYLEYIFCEIALRWMPRDPTNYQSTLFQAMAWCHHATSHYLNQCPLSPMTQYNITRSQRVKIKILFFFFEEYFFSSWVDALIIKFMLVQSNSPMLQMAHQLYKHFW